MFTQSNDPAVTAVMEAMKVAAQEQVEAGNSSALNLYGNCLEMLVATFIVHLAEAGLTSEQQDQFVDMAIYKAHHVLAANAPDGANINYPPLPELLQPKSIH